MFNCLYIPKSERQSWRQNTTCQYSNTLLDIGATETETTLKRSLPASFLPILILVAIFVFFSAAQALCNFQPFDPLALPHHHSRRGVHHRTHSTMAYLQQHASSPTETIPSTLAISSPQILLRLSLQGWRQCHLHASSSVGRNQTRKCEPYSLLCISRKDHDWFFKYLC